jgi:proline dehydrogenase
MQDAADDLVTQMMQKYNKEKESFQYFTNVPLGSIILKIYIEKQKIEGFIGMKLSVGVYGKENERAHASGYPTRFALLKKPDANLRYHFEIYRRQYRHDFILQSNLQ